jgi:Protein of unknown function (DUF3108)
MNTNEHESNKRFRMTLALMALPLVSCFAVAAEKKAGSSVPAPPAAEQLTYSINWPTGLSLGEARLETQREKTDAGERWRTEFTLDASVPGFPVMERVRSAADAEFCSAELEKAYTHGKRKAEETTTFDQQKGKAQRETKSGGKSELAIKACAKDALAYLDYLRHELSQGRLPSHQTVYFGAPYTISVQFAGTQQIMVSDTRMEADRLIATLKGEKTDITFEVFFSKDAARAPVLVKVPLQLATFSMELVR